MKITKWINQYDIIRSAHSLRQGALICIPTETVYGLAADAENEEAVSRIYSVKGRPTNHPLIVHFESLEYMDRWAKNIPNYAIKLAQEYWPGPMTLILERSHLAKDFITGGQDTIALRVPAHTKTQAFLKEFHKLDGNGVAAPSANRFGSVSPTNAESVKSELGNYLNPEKDLIVDGGQCSVGIESTIIDCTSRFPRILRPGLVSEEMIFNSSGLKPSKIVDSKIRVPGSLEQHYSPKAEISLGGKLARGNGFIALKKIKTPLGGVRLAEPENLSEFARILYVAFRIADSRGITKILVVLPEGPGLALAIRDRVIRAAGKVL
jgi:L-threonylcarbamoyladenylate synthase